MNRKNVADFCDQLAMGLYRDGVRVRSMRYTKHDNRHWFPNDVHYRIDGYVIEVRVW